MTYTLGGTATGTGDDSDYTHTPATLTFVDGEDEKQITITINEDALNEGQETITVQLAQADGIDLFGGGLGTVTILDNDNTEPTVGFVLATQDVQEGTTTNVDPQILVRLTDGTATQTPSGRRVTVNFAFTEGTADDPLDFALASGATNTLTFEPGVTEQAVPVAIVPDSYDEDDEDFTITLSTPSNATLGTTSSTITIEDNDEAPEVSITAEEPVTETDTDATDTISVNLDTASGKTVTVPYTVTAGSATTADYTLPLVRWCLHQIVAPRLLLLVKILPLLLSEML